MRSRGLGRKLFRRKSKQLGPLFPAGFWAGQAKTLMLGKVVRLAGSAPKRMVLLHKTGKTDAWRSHPMFSASENIKKMFPGLGTAIVLFAGYVAVDKLMASPKKSGHGH
jgi:NADH dehydrogenase (ubiquinone) 1 beta subcomplex subunit 3